MGSSQLITEKVDFLHPQQWFYVSVVYGMNGFVDRRSLWQDLRFISSCIGASPWVQLGDYNVVR